MLWGCLNSRIANHSDMLPSYPKHLEHCGICLACPKCGSACACDAPSQLGQPGSSCSLPYPFQACFSGSLSGQSGVVAFPGLIMSFCTLLMKSYHLHWRHWLRPCWQKPPPEPCSIRPRIFLAPLSHKTCFPSFRPARHMRNTPMSQRPIWMIGGVRAQHLLTPSRPSYFVAGDGTCCGIGTKALSRAWPHVDGHAE